ncbi:MAG: protein phosphatase 2C domain-containing protein [Gammaproteobacteria bacterium]|jgi:serine/threonine protein phosphatase PrpC
MNNDNQVYTGVTLDSPVIKTLNTGDAAIFLRQAPYKQDSVEENNQDAAAVIPVGDKAVVLVIADGMGGAPSGDIAARLAILSLQKNLENASVDLLRDAILDGIEKANKAILQLENGAATTLAIVEINENRMRSYHVGDSGIIVTGQRGRLRLQTTAHSPTAYAVEAGYIDEAEALAHTERNIVSNIVGSRDLRIEIGPPLRLAPRDTVVVASDGLFDNMLTEEIIEQVRCGDLAKTAVTLAKTCAARMQCKATDAVSGHPDDLGFIIYRPRKRRN